jgi:hypothetical protein
LEFGDRCRVGDMGEKEWRRCTDTVNVSEWMRDNCFVIIIIIVFFFISLVGVGGGNENQWGEEIDVILGWKM